MNVYEAIAKNRQNAFWGGWESLGVLVRSELLQTISETAWRRVNAFAVSRCGRNWLLVPPVRAGVESLTWACFETLLNVNIGLTHHSYDSMHIISYNGYIWEVLLHRFHLKHTWITAFHNIVYQSAWSGETIKMKNEEFSTWEAPGNGDPGSTCLSSVPPASDGEVFQGFMNNEGCTVIVWVCLSANDAHHFRGTNPLGGGETNTRQRWLYGPFRFLKG